MAGGDEQLVRARHQSEVGQAVRTARSEPRPTAFDGRGSEFWNERKGERQQVLNCTRRGAFIKADILFRGTDQHPTIGTRYKVASAKK